MTLWKFFLKGNNCLSVLSLDDRSIRRGNSYKGKNLLLPKSLNLLHSEECNRVKKRSWKERIALRRVQLG